ncbi:MAG: hypothetical protein LBG91_05125 [Treponema sp.]|nr:hypothetical protein [Treponema sp.]
MSDFENPYQSPESPIIPEKIQDTGVFLSETMLRYLKEASPWLRFAGILGFIGCGFITFGGLIFMIIALTNSGLADDFGQFPLWLVALIYVPLGVLFFFPSRFIYNFGSKIRNYQFSNSEQDLELAFKNNKSLWKFLGIMSIVNLAFIPLSVVMAVIGGIAAAVNGLFR